MYDLVPIRDSTIEIIDGDRGKNYPQQNDFSNNGFCLFLNAKNVTGTGFNFENTIFISEERDNLMRKGKLQRGDIVLTTRGTVGNVGLYDNTIPYHHIRINSGMVIMRINDETFSKEYLYFLMQSSFVQNQINLIKTGSAQPQLPIKLLGDIKLIVPPLTIQIEIAKKATALQQKISHNENHIILLNQLIQTIYQSWFTDFNYPEATGEIQDGIPVGWIDSNVFDNVTEVREKNQKNLDYPVLSVVKEGEFKLSDDVFTKQVYSKSLTNYKIIRRNQVGYNPARANIGSIAMLTDFDIGLVSPVYVVFEVKGSITPTFFFYYMKQPMFAEGIKHHAIGTTRQNFPFDAFKMFPMIIPSMELQKRFEEIAKPIEQKIAKLKEESAMLAEIKGTLLPKLMSGELPMEVGEA